ncbi:hypothetical protein BH10BAC2_BH10BAC2_28340 [soil metagenome]
MPVKTHKYSNGEVTVVWKPETCIHSAICFRGLHDVFDPQKRPWININGATTDKIVEQVRKCPSGALSYFMNAEVESEEAKGKTIKAEETNIINIEVLHNGPLMIKTGCIVTYSDGRQEIKKGSTALCRCGGSSNKPYCDGTHRKNGFQG